MNRVQTIKNRISEKENEIKSLKTELTDAYANTFLTCKHCGKKSQTRKCLLIDFQQWDPNTGSPCGGFYEHAGYHWECPHCEKFYKNEVSKDVVYEMWHSFSGKEKIYKDHYKYSCFR